MRKSAAVHPVNNFQNNENILDFDRLLKKHNFTKERFDHFATKWHLSLLNKNYDAKSILFYVSLIFYFCYFFKI